MAGNDLDALGWASLVALVVVGVVAVADLITVGAIEPGVLALVGGVLAPIIPALVARSRNNGRRK